MPAVSSCVICGKPLDDDRKRRSDAVTCSRACRTGLWRARKRILRNGGVPGLSVTRDGSPTVASFEPPPSVATSPSDTRFAAQLAQLEEAARPLTDAEQRERSRARDLQRRNVGVLVPWYRDRLIGNARRAQAIEEVESHHPGQLAVQDPIHNPDPTVVARRGITSRHANRHVTADPNAYVDQPYPGPQTRPARYPRAPEAEMIDAPWSRGQRS